jgi:hypothetical protein
MQDGRTFNTAIVLGPDGKYDSETSVAVQRHLSDLFGQNDEDYFVFSEQTRDDPLRRKKYKIVYVEANDKKQSIIFDVTDSH